MLYQKYRPLTFDEIFGHKKIISGIIENVKNNKIPQSIFIEGLTGTGKTTLAYIIAKTINCENLQNGYNPCNKCKSCSDINKEQFVYSVNYFNGSNLDIDSVRDIEELSKTYNITASKRVIIIDELQELNNNKKAQKTLLSILEKVNKNTFFILLAMDASKVDKAIIGRCVAYSLKPIEFDVIAEYLYSICDKEKINLDEQKINALCTIGENSGGSMRIATSILERVIESNLWDEKELVSSFGLVGQKELYDICDNLLSGNGNIFKGVNFSDELIGRIRWILQLILKSKTEVELNKWEKNQIGQLIKYDVSKIIFTIDKLNELLKFSYNTKQLIEYYILLCLLQNKEENNQETEKKLNKNIEEQLTRRVRLPK